MVAMVSHHNTSIFPVIKAVITKSFKAKSNLVDRETPHAVANLADNFKFVTETSSRPFSASILLLICY